MIDAALDEAPPTEGQLQFLIDLGIKVPPNITRSQVSMLLDAALDLQGGVREGYDRQMKEAGFITHAATELQLLNELAGRGKLFFVFTLEDDEFRYKADLPMKGHLRWTRDLNLEDVQWILLHLTSSWAKKLDLKKYADEFDNELPKLEYTAGELVDDTVRTYKLDL